MVGTMEIDQVYVMFPTRLECVRVLEEIRWAGRPSCPYCRSSNCTSAPKERRHHCNNCNTTFSVTVGTILQRTKVDLQKWFFAIGWTLRGGNGRSIRGLAKELEVNRNTAWYMVQRIKAAPSRERALLKEILDRMTERDGFETESVDRGARLGREGR